MATDSLKTNDLLYEKKSEISQAIVSGAGLESEDAKLHFITSSKLDLDHFAAQSGVSEEPETEEVREIQTKTLYGMAEGFIRVLKSLDSEA